MAELRSKRGRVSAVVSGRERDWRAGAGLEEAGPAASPTTGDVSADARTSADDGGHSSPVVVKFRD